MLVLTRRPGESITLQTKNGDEIILLVVDMLGNRTKVGITAPRSCRVRRTELPESIEYVKRGAE